MRNIVFDIFGGRKNTLVLVAIIASAVLCGTNDLPVEDFTEALKWLVGIGVGGHALEGGLKSFNGKK
jgi:hypothetical protein